MKDALDVIDEDDFSEFMEAMDNYFKGNFKAFMCYASFSPDYLVFHRGIYYKDSLVGYTVFGLEYDKFINGKNPETVIFMLFIKPEYRQRGFGRMTVDNLKSYGLPLCIIDDGMNDWLADTELANHLNIY